MIKIHVVVPASFLLLGITVSSAGQTFKRHEVAPAAPAMQTPAQGAAAAAGLPQAAISLIGGGDRDELTQLATQSGVVDLIIPRGGEGLKAALNGASTKLAAAR